MDNNRVCRHVFFLQFIDAFSVQIALLHAFRFKKVNTKQMPQEDNLMRHFVLWMASSTVIKETCLCNSI